MEISPVVSGIYKITNIINGKIYIGQSIDIYNRWNSEKHGYGVSSHLLNAMNKYGKNNFEFEIIKECEGDLLNIAETFFILCYCSFNPDYGYNKTFGGSFCIFTDETISKMSGAQIKRFESPEQREITSFRTKLAMQNDDIKEKMINNRKGWYSRYSEEQKKNYAINQYLSNSGDNHWTQRHKISEATRSKLSQSHIGQIKNPDRGFPTRLVEKDIIFYNYRSIKLFLADNGFILSDSAVRARVYKATKTKRLAYGFHWEKVAPVTI
jgi:group I intron endonuclease